MNTPAEELHEAVYRLSNRMRRPGHCALVNLDLTGPLIELLETSAAYLDLGEPASIFHLARALDVARAINTQE